MKRVYDLADLVLPLRLGTFAARAYPKLPAVLTAVLTLMVLLVPRLAADPRAVNIPHKAEFLKLPAEKQAVCWALYKGFFAALAASLNLLFYVLLRGAAEVALGSRTRLPLNGLLPVLAIMAGLMIYDVRRMVILPVRLIRGED
jgi:hypothetical protein